VKCNFPVTAEEKGTAIDAVHFYRPGNGCFFTGIIFHVDPAKGITTRYQSSQK
jgi:hypothetical protein